MSEEGAPARVTSVAIDCMGGDFGPEVTVASACNYVLRHDDVRIILVGIEHTITPLLERFSRGNKRLTVKGASEIVRMDESPAVALRGKKNSSMRVAIDLVKAGEADACVSAGNTGALMAISRFVLKTLPGIDRPAIVSILPSAVGKTYVLDLGANVDCEANHLLQFGVMGSALVSALEHKERPSVGLLNVGEESIKGNAIVKEAGDLLSGSGLNFIGNVEGDDIYGGKSDVVVCDGFVGNVTLKASEGLAQLIGGTLKREFSRNMYTRIAALLAVPVLRSFKRLFDHRRYNGAILIGLQGVVIKSHGSADVIGFENAIDRAVEAVKGSLLERIARRYVQAGQ